VYVSTASKLHAPFCGIPSPSPPLIGITELAEKSLQNPFYKRLMYQNTRGKGVSLRGPRGEDICPHYASKNDRRLGLWMARLDITGALCKVSGPSCRFHECPLVEHREE
jgi:hypothetical protein